VVDLVARSLPPPRHPVEEAERLEALWVVSNAHCGGSDDQRAAVVRGGTAGLSADEAGRVADGRAGFLAAVGAVLEMAKPQRVRPLRELAQKVLRDIRDEENDAFAGEPAAARAALEGMRAGFAAAIARDGDEDEDGCERGWEWEGLECQFDEAMEALESGDEEGEASEDEGDYIYEGD
jgi:hypothetical protein